MPPLELQVRQTKDCTAAFNSVPVARDVPYRRLTLRITPSGGKFELEVFPDEALQGLFPERSVPLKLTQAQLWGVVRDCQKAWRRHVVDAHTVLPRREGAKLKRLYYFHRQSEKPVAEGDYKKILKELAGSGRDLFIQIFRPSGPEFAATRRVGKALKELAAEPDVWVTVMSRDFCAPWNLMYLGDEESAEPERFWGHQHVIEHDLAECLTPTTPFAPSLGVALHFDEKLDTDERFRRLECNRRLKQLFQTYQTELAERNTFADFKNALRAGADEQIFYFCCHARFDGDEKLSFDEPRLFLTLRPPQVEPEPIEPRHIDRWLDDREILGGHPLIFLNGCEGAKMGSIFYQGFAATFLDHEARAVIGPETEMPAVFARDFAREFFTDFFRGGPENSLGLVLLRLRRRFMREQLNPLGLVYSLYRGGDIYIDGHVPSAPTAAAARPDS